MKLSTLGLLCIWLGLTATQAGIIMRSTDDFTKTVKAERLPGYPPISNMNSRCNPKRRPSSETLDILENSHQYHQKYSKEAWKSDFEPNKHDSFHPKAPENEHINDGSNHKASEKNVEIQPNMEPGFTKINTQHANLELLSDEVGENIQAPQNADSIEIVLRKESKSEFGPYKIKEIEINLHSSKKESIHAEDTISIEIVANNLGREAGLANASLNSEDDATNQSVADDYPDAEPRNPVLSNLSSPPSHRGFRTGIPDDQIEAQDSVGEYGDLYL